MGSCEKRELITEPSAVAEIQALTVDEQIQTPEIQTAIANGEDFKVVYPPNSEMTRAYKEGPSGCRCFMRVVAVENTPNPNGGQTWALTDVSTNGNPDFVGIGTGATAKWGDNSSGFYIYYLLPSPSLEINPLNLNGSSSYYGIYKHMFYMTGDVATAPGFEIQTEVVCYGTDSQGNFINIGQPESYDFKWDEGGVITAFGGIAYRPFFANFSCQGVKVKIDPLALGS